MDAELVIDVIPKVSLPRQAKRTSKEAVNAFIEWCYHFRQSDFPAQGTNINGKTLLSLWILAGHLRVPSCQNDCIVAIERERQKQRRAQIGELEWVWQNTQEYPSATCGLRNLLIDQGSLALGQDGFSDVEKADGGDFPDKLSKPALVEMVKRRGRNISDRARDQARNKAWKPDFEYTRGDYWVKE